MDFQRDFFDVLRKLRRLPQINPKLELDCENLYWDKMKIMEELKIEREKPYSYTEFLGLKSYNQELKQKLEFETKRNQEMLQDISSLKQRLAEAETMLNS